MELQGIVIAILEPRSGVSQRGTNWMVQSFVIETHEQYPKKMCFEIFGEERLKSYNIQMGEELVVYFDVEAREYQGKWFNSIRAWKVERFDPAAAGAQGPVPAAPIQAAPTNTAAPIQAAPTAQPAPVDHPSAPFPPAQADAADESEDLPF